MYYYSFAMANQEFWAQTRTAQTHTHTNILYYIEKGIDEEKQSKQKANEPASERANVRVPMKECSCVCMILCKKEWIRSERKIPKMKRTE